jgi:hypothetical protein
MRTETRTRRRLTKRFESAPVGAASASSVGPDQRCTNVLRTPCGLSKITSVASRTFGNLSLAFPERPLPRPPTSPARTDRATDGGKHRRRARPPHLASHNSDPCLPPHRVRGHQIGERYLRDHSYAADATRWETGIAWPISDSEPVGGSTFLGLKVSSLRSLNSRTHSGWRDYTSSAPPSTLITAPVP